MLYHPCTHHTLVEKLRSLVKGCIRCVYFQKVYQSGVYIFKGCIRYVYLIPLCTYVCIVNP